MPIIQTRRRFLTAVSLAGAAGVVRLPPVLAEEGGLETTTVRIGKSPGICVAPQYVAEELLRAEGFTDVRYIWRSRPLQPSRSRMAKSIST
jgi:NitT/TauT family transport system substrate-binding protein